LLCSCSKIETTNSDNTSEPQSVGEKTEPNSGSVVISTSDTQSEPGSLTSDIYAPSIDCDPIDKSLDCEKILLDRAESLREMMTDYYNPDRNKLVYETGEFEEIQDIGLVRRVISSELNSYSDFKSLFKDSIYDQYIDMINNSDRGFREIDGKLYVADSTSGGPRGSVETWYLGYDVEDDRIIGHFAELRADPGSNEPIGAEFLNDESNYGFYDIIVQNVGGKYVLTNCVDPENKQFYIEHGWLYNSGIADRKLITNEKFKPKSFPD